ncbi:HAMP domain-containing histidine kinase [Limisalsivibrio acetivorans]|uniref:HAMP domain-containing histidine kinase n=1 Tax=Limisalsivibrio acetivorans TaxID=1304888 RepID=UPI0003B43B49|nr:HAMP domain-containing histidine kinase [Limisalsivibrio acetivorans]
MPKLRPYSLRQILLHSFLLLFFTVTAFLIIDHYLSQKLAFSRLSGAYTGVSSLIEETLRTSSELSEVRISTISGVLRSTHNKLNAEVSSRSDWLSNTAGALAGKIDRPVYIEVYDNSIRRLNGYSSERDDRKEFSLFNTEDFVDVQFSGATKLKHEYYPAVGVTIVQSLSWSQSRDMFLHVYTRYSAADELHRRLTRLSTESEMFKDINIYSVRDERIDPIYGSAGTPVMFRSSIIKAAREGELFMNDRIFKRMENSSGLPWDAIVYETVFSPDSMVSSIWNNSMIYAVILAILVFAGLIILYINFRMKFQKPYEMLMDRFSKSRTVEKTDFQTSELSELAEAYNSHLIVMKGVHSKLNEYNTALREQALEEAHRLERQKEFMVQQLRLTSIGEMVNSLSHHWREPLSLMYINMRNIKDEMDSGRYDEFYLEECIGNCREQLKLMQEAVGRFIEFIDEERKGEEFSLHGVLDEVLSFVTVYYEKDGILIKDDIDSAKGVMLMGEASVIKQILLNVLMQFKKALDETESGTGVVSFVFISSPSQHRISLSEETGSVSFTRPDDFFDNLRFYDNDKGIGLYVSRRLIQENFGGSLEASSDQSGSRFDIIIPTT